MTAAVNEKSAPAPLIDASVDLKGFAGFILDVEALLSSELVALATPEEVAAALMLWCRAWQQVPHGSLPNDERVLAAFSRSKNWKRVRDMALRGFVLCSDGRLYHRTLCRKVEEAWAQRQAYVKRREKDAARLNGWRERRQKASAPAGIDFGAGIEVNADTVDDTDNAVETRFNVATTPLRREERREEMGRDEMGSEGIDTVPGGTVLPGAALGRVALEAA